GPFVSQYLRREADYVLGSQYPTIVLLAGMYCWAFGFWIARTRTGFFESSVPLHAERSAADTQRFLFSVVPVVGLAIGGTLALFVLGGVPLFSLHANQERFTVIQ